MSNPLHKRKVPRIENFLATVLKSGCGVIQLHTCACKECFVFNFVINWRFRWIDHKGSCKPVSLPPVVVHITATSLITKVVSVLYVHSQFLCSLASFKLSTVGIRHPRGITSLLDCYSTRHSRSLILLQLWTALSQCWVRVLLHTVSADFCSCKQARSHGGVRGSATPNFVVLRNICFKHIIKTKDLPT